MQTFAVHRVTVRETLKILEASGLVTLRVGAGGGTFVITGKGFPPAAAPLPN